MEYHILNGDALKAQLPDDIPGMIIVLKECLVDGDVSGQNLEDLFKTRSNFFQRAYGPEKSEYYQKAVPEIKKILKIAPEARIHLWFEDDLFCQVNFWFTLNLLQCRENNYCIYLVRPSSSLELGFGGMNRDELIIAYQNKVLLSHSQFKKLSQLWPAYQNGDLEKLKAIGHELIENFPYLLPAIQAHIGRIPVEGKPGRPIQSLAQILKENSENDFATIFRIFSQKEAIYGFGDLQVKRLLEQLKK